MFTQLNILKGKSIKLSWTGELKWRKVLFESLGNILKFGSVDVMQNFKLFYIHEGSPS